MLAHRPSLDLLDGLDLDFLTANYGLGSDMEMNMNINVNSTRENNGNRNSIDIDPRKGEINRNQNQKDDIESDEIHMSEYLNNDEFLIEFENENDSFKTENINTGNKDFKYNDHFVDREDSFRHSKWLSFMNKRLKLSKNLLKDTGLIFISIDDNEVAQLKMLCDKIFFAILCLEQSLKQMAAGKLLILPKPVFLMLQHLHALFLQ